MYFKTISKKNKDNYVEIYEKKKTKTKKKQKNQK